MKTTLPLLLVIFNSLVASAYNLATDYCLVYENPKDNHNFFGLSVVLSGGRSINESW